MRRASRPRTAGRSRTADPLRRSGAALVHCGAPGAVRSSPSPLLQSRLLARPGGRRRLAMRKLKFQQDWRQFLRAAALFQLPARPWTRRGRDWERWHTGCRACRRPLPPAAGPEGATRKRSAAKRGGEALPRETSSARPSPIPGSRHATSLATGVYQVVTRVLLLSFNLSDHDALTKPWGARRPLLAGTFMFLDGPRALPH